MNKKFHLRQRSTTTSPLDKDLPLLPREESVTTPRIPFPTIGIENVPRKGKNSGTPPITGSRAGIMRRVSSIFGTRKKPPKNLSLRNTPLQSKSSFHPYMGSCDSSESFADSENDIRRPSGLGSAVSFSSNRSMPPSPFMPIEKDSPFNAHVVDEVGGYHRTRSTSTPNLLRSFGWHPTGGKPRERHDSESPMTTILQSAKSVFKRSTPPPREVPVEVALLIVHYLPPNAVASVAPISSSFASAVRTTLYSHLDIQQLSVSQLEKLIAVLATRPNLTDLVERFSCSTWPIFFRASQQASKVVHHDADHHNALLTATFTLAFQRMGNLTHLTLPGVDASLLVYHTAFGLRSITLLCECMDSSEKEELFHWLDGQINIDELRLPYLLDSKEDDSSDSASNNTSQTKSIYIPKHNYTRSNSMLFPFPSPPTHIPLLSTSPTSTPQTASFIASPITPVFHYHSPTLLPNLQKLHAPPSIVSELVSSLERSHSPISFGTNSSTTSKRPLSHVILNVSSTLYTGLRPASLVAPLQGITHLGLRFTENVDRRTVEKVLGAAGTALGSAKDNGASEGLQTLVIQITQTLAESDEILYKTVQSVLPRYSALRSLRLHFSSPDQSFRLFYAAEPEVQIYRPLIGSEQARKEMWTKQCPLLEEIFFLSGRFWKRNL